MWKTTLVVAILVGCASDDGASSESGVDQSKQVAMLSAGEITTFCEWAIEVQGGAGHTTTCSDDVTLTVNTQAQCEAGYSQLQACMATVGQVEACVNALAANACTGIESAACAAYIACIAGDA